jgi:hypothetical protein
MPALLCIRVLETFLSAVPPTAVSYKGSTEHFLLLGHYLVEDVSKRHSSHTVDTLLPTLTRDP